MAGLRMQSPGVKMLLLGTIQLLLLIPLLQVQGLVHERAQRQREAESGIADQWGRAQQFAPAYLTIDLPVRDEQGKRVLRTAVLLPDSVEVSGKMQPEWRHRGIFSVPVYTAELKINARFAARDLAKLAADSEGRPFEPRLRVALADARGVRALSALKVSERELAAEAAGRELGELDALGAALGEIDPKSDLTVAYSATIAGSERLDLLPVARDTRVDISGQWRDPSFVGAFLPASHALDADGFSAHWQVLGFNRSIPQRFWLDSAPVQVLRSSAFGVNLYQSNDVYQQNERAGKYDLMICALVFLALFLFETIGGMSLHPIQYGFVGLALALFYLLLIAFSEHLGFDRAYAYAATAAVLMVGGYARAVLASSRRALLLAAMQAGAYGVFYLLVKSEDYALLLGACALTLVLAAAMYLTRRVNWSRAGAAAAT